MSDFSSQKSLCCTQSNVIVFSQEWTIRNFSFICGKKTGECLQSTLFPAGANNNSSKWCLTLYPNGHSETYKQYLSLYLTLKSSHRKTVFVNFKVYLWNTKLKKYEIISSSKVVHRFETDTPEKSWGNPKFYERDLMLNTEKGFLSNDTLILKCEVSESLETISVSDDRESNEQPSKFELGLPNHLELLFNQKKLSDVTLSVGDEEFSAHKCILVARSSVFAAMFEHDMVEQRQSRVTITDIASSVVKEMLIFIYTDKSPNLENMAEDLLAAADKYNLSKLKRMCEDVLCGKINSDNVADMLKLADLYRAEMLGARAVTLISVQATKLMDTCSWKNMLLENSNLVREAYLSIKRPRTD